ncbi:hypothetical protein I1A62_03190 (plasmid) [Rhodococcus sp. USK10]|nr:hypothetical protein I1A62_03190 [Rhodococcus sp. USK10]
MRTNGWQGATRTQNVRTTVPDVWAPRPPGLGDQNFSSRSARRLYVGDFTYLEGDPDAGPHDRVVHDLPGRHMAEHHDLLERLRLLFGDRLDRGDGDPVLLGDDVTGQTSPWNGNGNTKRLRHSGRFGDLTEARTLKPRLVEHLRRPTHDLRLGRHRPRLLNSSPHHKQTI